MEKGMEERILITGGEGFLGRHLQNYYFSKGIDYDTLDIHSSDRFDDNPTWQFDVTRDIPLAIGKYSKVVHLAGVLGTHELFKDVNRAIDVNIRGTVNVLNFCKQTGTPFHGITMDHVWVNPYETTKLAAERLAEAWSREYGFPVKYTTVYNAYGEEQAYGPGHPQKIIPTFATKAWAGEPFPIWGSGEQLVDLIYAGQVAEIIGDDLDVDGGLGIGFTVLEVAHLVWEAAGGGETMPVEMLPMRRGEHEPSRAPVAQNPFRGVLTERLFETVQSYRQ